VVGALGWIFLRTLLDEVRQPEAKLAPAEPNACTRKRRKFPRVGVGATDKLPDAVVMLTVVKSCHAPHALLLVESENWMLYPLMVLLIPALVPLHDSVAFPSEMEGLTETVVGAAIAVVLGVHSMASLICDKSCRPVNDI
jgi:hypothetical protein